MKSVFFLASMLSFDLLTSGAFHPDREIDSGLKLSGRVAEAV
jgi:hypothetical protein